MRKVKSNAYPNSTHYEFFYLQVVEFVRPNLVDFWKNGFILIVHRIEIFEGFMKNIAIIGSTGSIGQNTLKVIRHLNKDFRVVSLAAHRNIDLLVEQAKEFHPRVVAIFDESLLVELKKRLPGVEVVSSFEGLTRCATLDEADQVVIAVNSSIALAPTVDAIKAKKSVALATKEVLVSAGPWIMSLAKENGVQIIPVDSELTALFQCLNGEDIRFVDRLILTASGGPFRDFTAEDLRRVTVKDALNHPNYSMGSKVTIDSSTLMNKGLEALEASSLFGLPLDRIEAVIHPQQVVHSMVEFQDRAIMAQMGEPHMLPPIQYALTYPQRAPGLLQRFDFTRYSRLDFRLPDLEKFRCLKLAYHAGRAGGSMPCFMNAANEVLVKRFIMNEINWLQIGEKLENLMHGHSIEKMDSFDTILSIEGEARALATKA